jgi:hypothetical protein
VKKIYQTSKSKLIFDIRNAREIRLYKDDEQYNFIHTVSNGKILTIEYADLKIAINEDFTIDEESYNITEINENKEFYILYVSKINKITLFSLPMFFDTRDVASTSNLINVYYGDSNSGNNHNLYFHYRYNSEPRFKETERILTKDDYFVNETDVDRFHTVYQAKIPTKWIFDFDKIIDGKYSKISNKFKLKIIKFHSLKSDKYLYQVINRDKKLLDKMELDLNVKIPDEIDLMSKINLTSVNYSTIKTINNERK